MQSRFQLFVDVIAGSFSWRDAMSRQCGILFVTILSIAPLTAQRPVTDRVTISPGDPQTCPVTQPSQAFSPPSPYPTEHSPDSFWFGSEKLWVQLPKDGTWNRLPHYRPTDSAFRQKIQWWRKGYDWHTDNPTKLKVTGERLDAPAPHLGSQSNASFGGPQSFIMSGLDIPTLGCWQITADYAGDKLTFVVWIAP
jgi:hypothetical protein